MDLTFLAPFADGVPVDPDAPEARDWLIEELSKPEYQRAKPSLVDQLVSAFWDWVQSLQLGTVEGPPAFGLLTVVIVLVVAGIVAFLVFGVPRLSRRSSAAGALFGDEDDRNAAAMRRAALAAASAGDHQLAIVEMFRAIARGLAERTIVSTSPGTTAHDFAQRAAQVFPQHGDALAEAARSFDDVRYLGGIGSAAAFDQIASLERALHTAKPAFEPELVDA